MRVAAVDVGSNTIHALVADVEGGRVEDLGHFVEMPSLGAEVSRTGRIGVAKGAEAIEALRSVVSQARDLGFEHLIAGATEAIRRAADRDEFLAAATVAIGHPVHLIPAKREAELSFAGVASRHAARKRWLMGDLGGGSTELVEASARRIVEWRSLPIGSGVLASKYLSDPPRPGEREALRKEAVELLAKAPESEPTKLVVTGGTSSNIPKVLSALRPPMVLTTQALLRAEQKLDSAPASELEARHLLRPGRVQAMRGGIEVLLLLLDWAGLDRLHVSIEGLRQGMILAYLERGSEWWVEGSAAAQPA